MYILARKYKISNPNNLETCTFAVVHVDADDHHLLTTRLLSHLALVAVRASVRTAHRRSGKVGKCNEMVELTIIG